MNRELSGGLWFKSSYSQSGGDCVEVAHLDGDTVGVRDSKNPLLGTLRFTANEWDAFLAGARTGEFDRC